MKVLSDKPDQTLVHADARQATLSTYIAGFVLSLVLTLAAFSLIWRYTQSENSALSVNFLMAAVAALAITQLMVQLVFFLHLSRESKPRWNFTVMSFAALIVVILVFGSLWIMANLRYHHGAEQAPAETETYIIDDEGISR